MILGLVYDNGPPAVAGGYQLYNLVKADRALLRLPGKPSAARPSVAPATNTPVPQNVQAATRVGYRVVEDAELQDIIARGTFRFPQGGDTPTGEPGKWFYTTRLGALDTAAHWESQGGGPFTLIRAEIPRSSITFRGRIDPTPTMPLGKRAFFSEFCRGLGIPAIEINPPP